MARAETEAPGLPPVTWFGDDPRDHRPSLSWPPVSRWAVKARVGRGVAAVWWWRDHAWLRVGTRGLLHPTRGAVSLAAGRDALVVVHDGGGLVVHPDGADVWGARARAGADVRIHRDGARWTGPTGLPDGAARARTTRPWATGHGVAWTDAGTVYRWSRDDGTQAIGVAPEAATLQLGPVGALLVVVDGHAVSGAAPAWPLVHLPHPVPCTVSRWTRSGLHACIRGPDGFGCVQLADGRLRATEPPHPPEDPLAPGPLADHAAQAHDALADGSAVDVPIPEPWSALFDTGVVVDGRRVLTAEGGPGLILPR